MIIYSVIESHSAQANEIIAQWANEEDRVYSLRKKKADAQNNSLLARAALRRLLSVNNYNFSESISYSELGKPYLQNGPYISLSHSYNMAACAISGDLPIGIDIEYWKNRDFFKLAAYAFGPDEVKLVEKAGAAEFYRIWTIREAIAKSKGESIFSNIDGNDVDLTQWQSFYDLPFKNYSLAIVTKKLDNSTGFVVTKV